MIQNIKLFITWTCVCVEFVIQRLELEEDRLSSEFLICLFVQELKGIN